jgi:hypothetical protein
MYLTYALLPSRLGRCPRSCAASRTALRVPAAHARRGVLFWANKSAYASAIILLGGWVLFRSELEVRVPTGHQAALLVWTSGCTPCVVHSLSALCPALRADRFIGPALGLYKLAGDFAPPPV